jgi:restriction system protein
LKSAVLRRAVDRLFELTTGLPWWAGLLSAIAAYTLLHPIAMVKVSAPAASMDVVAIALVQLLILVAQIGQLLLPLAFLTVSVVSGLVHWMRRGLCESVAQDSSGSSSRGLSWAELHLLVGEVFRRQGYRVSSPPPDSLPHDAGLEMSKEGRRFLVDYSDWRSWKAGAAALHNLHALMEKSAVTGGFAVTSGQFVPEARHFAAEKGIELVDGRNLKRLLRVERQPAKDSPWAFAVASIGRLGSILARWREHAAKQKHLLQARSILARWRELVLTRWRASRSYRLERESDIRRAREGISDVGSLSISPDMDKQPRDVIDAETTTARQLTALIQAERRLLVDRELPRPPVRRRRVGPSRPGWKLPRMRIRKVADLLGVLVTLGILWGLYEWFLQLPPDPEGSPWALLGAQSDSQALMRRLHGLENAQATAKMLAGDRPLGQYLFGPPPGFLAMMKPEIPVQKTEPVEVYHSLRELEEAFDAKYVPPPECYAYGSDSLVKCGNHRIRARRDFIASGGKVTPMLLGSWEEPRPVVMDAHSRDWQEGDEQDAQLQWRDAPADRREVPEAQDWRQQWSRQRTEQPDDVRQRGWASTPPQASASNGDWRQGGAQDAQGRWSGDWGSEPSPMERRQWVDDL